jgi:hypothetical protein
MPKPKVFISYSHKDNDWKNRLVTHLGVLQEQGLLDLWDDCRISAGQDWYQAIRAAIDSATVAILLISANFLTSRFILSEEVPRLLQRRASTGFPLFPIIIKPCAWQAVDWLRQMQLRPAGERLLSSSTEHQIDTDLAGMAREVEQVLQSVWPLTASQKFDSLNMEKTSISYLSSARGYLTNPEQGSKLLANFNMKNFILNNNTFANYEKLKEG